MSETDFSADRKWALETIDQAVLNGKLLDSTRENLVRWIREPQYEKSLPGILELLKAEEFGRLNDLFWEVINFGTGGRRGEMSDFGSATINERTIAESAHGLGSYFMHTNHDQPGRAVIAHDTRNRSPEFARLTATTLAAHGFEVFFFDTYRSTPELSFAVRHLNCDVGAMISASHNAPSDNGFKAYWGSGAQVLTPHDKGIIDAVYKASEIPTIDFNVAVQEGKIKILDSSIDDDYLAEVCKLSYSDKRDIVALFTPLHGVGETNVYDVLKQLGFDGLQIFEPHRQPDGNFSNVPDHLPNPERFEVFRPTLEPAAAMGAELILASDPDADRIAICVRNGAGEYIPVTGNQAGALIVDYLLRKRKAEGTLSPSHFIVETLVTTPLIADQGRKYNVKVVDDLLVGFKYIAQSMDNLGPDKFIFGAEESLGYLAGEYCRDKDAAVAAMYLMEYAAELKADSGKTLLDQLDELYREYGFYLEGQTSKICEGSDGQLQIQKLMKAFREQPPKELAGNRFLEVRDYETHEVRDLPNNSKSADLPEPAGNLMVFKLEGDAARFRIAVRPSGTEPKIKFYYFAQADVPVADQLDATKTTVREELTRLQESLNGWIDAQLS
ncbi:Phosphoglucomutase [Polystyrenella longa]|uniref:Phosphoglucomutase n=1 Tax=Polystyrenella longa TaxID=2528007 RepID=A0A518CRP1_9PLAN|nr:phospho-sugar mutase [Polystyrenella longa]QDU81880.1 Phosphoglucomutase [Polystyrenella longa]